jgi:hypothetical protein
LSKIRFHPKNGIDQITLLVSGILVESPEMTPEAAAGEGTMTMRRPWLGMVGFVAVLLVLALGHRWSVTASWFTSDKTCRERHATRWFVARLDMDCDRLLRARLWELYDGGHLFGRLRGGRGGAVEIYYEAARASRRVVVVP